MRIFGLQPDVKVADAKTVWLFREHRNELNLMEALLNRFHEQLVQQGYAVRAGHLSSGDLAVEVTGKVGRVLYFK